MLRAIYMCYLSTVQTLALPKFLLVKAFRNTVHLAACRKRKPAEKVGSQWDDNFCPQQSIVCHANMAAIDVCHQEQCGISTCPGKLLESSGIHAMLMSGMLCQCHIEVTTLWCQFRCWKCKFTIGVELDIMGNSVWSTLYVLMLFQAGKFLVLITNSTWLNPLAPGRCDNNCKN